MRLQSDCGSNAQNGQAADVPSEWMTVAEMQEYMQVIYAIMRDKVPYTASEAADHIRNPAPSCGPALTLSARGAFGRRFS